MNIDRMEFIAWMERIMERFDILKEYGIAERSEQKGFLYCRGNIEHCPKPV